MLQAYCLIWLLIIPLYMLLNVCWFVWGGWWRSPDCLSKHDPEFPFIVNLSLLCPYCEIPKDYIHGCIWCGFSHLIRGLTNHSGSEAFEVSFISSFSFVLCFFPSSSVSYTGSWNALFFSSLPMGARSYRKHILVIGLVLCWRLLPGNTRKDTSSFEGSLTG